MGDSVEKPNEQTSPDVPVIPADPAALLPIASRIFWWGNPNEWLDDPIRFGAQVMTGRIDSVEKDAPAQQIFAQGEERAVSISEADL